jgi:hypothetical protein
VSCAGTGFLCPNNPLNMHALMLEKLQKYAHKKFIPNTRTDFTLF